MANAGRQVQNDQPQLVAKLMMDLLDSPVIPPANLLFPSFAN
jgi:hypothetical protein